MYLALGGSTTGTQFHKHVDGWYVQVHGKKRWMLYPPNHMPPKHYPVNGLSVSKWIQSIYTEIDTKRKPHECVLGPGDLIYAPESWYHATLCLGESLGVAGQGPGTDTAWDQQAGRGAGWKSHVQKHWDDGTVYCEHCLKRC
jgi:hypothetical protein